MKTVEYARSIDNENRAIIIKLIKKGGIRLCKIKLERRH